MKPAFLAALAALGLTSAAHAAPLTVTISDVEARGGKLYISVQTKSQFMMNEGTAGEVIDAPTAGNHTFSYDVPEGAYVVSVWHDDNGNGEFDRDSTTFWPLDGWAMHKGSELTGPPTFDDVSIDVGSSGATVSEQISYGR